MTKRGIKKRKRSYRQKYRRIATICGLTFACFLLIYIVAYIAIFLQVRKVPENKVAKGVYIGQVDVAGMTAKQAQKALDKKSEEYKKLDFTFQAGDKEGTVSLGELGFDIKKEEKLIKQAIQYGKTGSVWNRYFRLRKLKKENKIFKPEYAIEEETANKALQAKVGELLPGAKSARVDRKQGEFVIQDEQEGIVLDEKATIKSVETFLNKKWDGKAGTIKAVTKIETPKVTRKDLETIQDKLGTFSTYCGSGQARVTNIIRGTELIDGVVLLPGQEFSAGQKMMPFTKENKYVEAGAYENGEVVESIAGGICQVSTTLYNAAINAELEIVQRFPHSMIVNYVKPSRDAAIAGDYKDLKFRNNYDTPIYIEGFVSDGNVVFSIYGKETRPAGREIKFISETMEVKEPTKKYEEEREAKIGSMRGPGSYHQGRKAQLWKVVYENGKQVSKKVFNKSTYNPSSYKVMVGTASSNPEYSSIVRRAIASQDEAKIRAAIAQVRAQEAKQRENEKETPKKEETKKPETKPEEKPEEEQPEQPEKEE